MNTERTLRLRLRNAKGFTRQVLDLAEEQQWGIRQKDDGFLLYPPGQTHQHVFVRDPGNDSGLIKLIRSRLSKAGLKFPDDHEKRQPPAMNKPSPPASPTPAITPSVDVFEQLKVKVNEAVSLFAEIDSLIEKARQDSAKFAALRAALRGLDN